ncbi:DUF983 domain-containing protein [Bythopirellula polymerisocia]|uniref:DUF983 domain-containing protein n=1 Tax=Bythopirellula polymerisocia TaxID=2528003 RepID=A0A5C6CK18_9BACT|nr:DUF983 domain-containing protein [Bythopirellula polymerisocia]TWU23641.1 hypothetical protein Pla144_38160 [Bythopirellula polymerisocia]
MNEADSGEPSPPTLGTCVGRALRLKCPACGQHKMFRNWITMVDPCPACGRKFDRAPGYLLGSIYINYGVTAFLIVVLYFGLFLSKSLTGSQLLWVLSGLGLLFPLWFFRYARALWIAFDERWDPWPNDEERRSMANEAKPSGIE